MIFGRNRSFIGLLLIVNCSIILCYIGTPRRIDAHSMAYKHSFKPTTFDWPLFQTFVENRWSYAKIGKTIREFWMFSVGKYNYNEEDPTRSGNKLYVFHIDAQIVILLSDFSIIHQTKLSRLKSWRHIQCDL